MKKHFNIGEAIGFGWDRAVKNIYFFIPLFAIIILAFLFLKFFQFFSLITGPVGILLFLIIALFLFLLKYYILAFFYKISLYLTKKENANFEIGKEIFPSFIKFIFGMIAYQLIVILGLFLFIVPGIIWMLKYQFVPFILLDDKKISINEAFKKSNEIASGVQWNLFWIQILYGLINFTGCLFFFGIGLIFTIPTVFSTKAYIYNKFK